MKNHFLTLIILAVLVIITGCKTKKTTGDDSSQAGSSSGDAVCIWENSSLKESPDKDGKWLASISLGEKCLFLDSEREDVNGEKKTRYLKIRLQDGKEGWVQSDFIVVGGRPGVIIQDAAIYSRPDLLTNTGKSFTRMDVIGVKGTQNDFVEVTGKRNGGKWIETGWIKAPNISYSEIDIAVARYAAKAMIIGETGKRDAALQAIVDNKDLQGSVFMTDLKDQLIPAEEFIEAEIMSQVTDSTLSKGE